MCSLILGMSCWGRGGRGESLSPQHSKKETALVQPTQLYQSHSHYEIKPGLEGLGMRPWPGLEGLDMRPWPGLEGLGMRPRPGLEGLGMRPAGAGRPGYETLAGAGRPGYETLAGAGRPGYETGAERPGYETLAGAGRPGYETLAGAGRPVAPPSNSSLAVLLTCENVKGVSLARWRAYCRRGETLLTRSLSAHSNRTIHVGHDCRWPLRF